MLSEEKRQLSAEIMRRIYDETGGSISSWTRPKPICVRLGVESERESDEIIQYLVAAGFVEQSDYSDEVRLTEPGVQEVRRVRWGSSDSATASWFPFKERHELEAPQGENSEFGNESPVRDRKYADAQEPRRFWQRISSNQWIIAVVGGALAATIGGFVVTHLPGASPDRKRSTTVSLTVENVRSYGVWTRNTPYGEFSTEGNRPPKAGEWLAQGATVSAVCAQSAGSYNVIANGNPQVWSWWIKLHDGMWIQSAGVSQTDTSGNGPVPNVPRCSG